MCHYQFEAALVTLPYTMRSGCLILRKKYQEYIHNEHKTIYIQVQFSNRD